MSPVQHDRDQMDFRLAGLLTYLPSCSPCQSRSIWCFPESDFCWQTPCDETQQHSWSLQTHGGGLTQRLRRRRRRRTAVGPYSRGGAGWRVEMLSFNYLHLCAERLPNTSRVYKTKTKSRNHDAFLTDWCAHWSNWFPVSLATKEQHLQPGWIGLNPPWRFRVAVNNLLHLFCKRVTAEHWGTLSPWDQSGKIKCVFDAGATFCFQYLLISNI